MKIRRSVLQIFGLSILVMVFMFGIITPTLSPARAAEINLKFATLFPPQDPMCFGPQFMFKELEKRTNGKVKVTEYYSQSLGKAPEMLDMIETGIADFITFPIAVFKRCLAVGSNGGDVGRAVLQIELADADVPDDVQGLLFLADDHILVVEDLDGIADTYHLFHGGAFSQHDVVNRRAVYA